MNNDKLNEPKNTNWSDKQIWKQSFISTFICLLGCSIGAMGITFYLLHSNFFLVLLISLIAGFISCMLFMIVWEMIFHKMNLIDAIIHSYKMSFVSICIMIITENIIVFLLSLQYNAHQMQMAANNKHHFYTMIFAMGLGFILCLPYNYFQLQKNGKICH